MKKKQLILSLSILTGIALFFLINSFLANENEEYSGNFVVERNQEDEYTVAVLHADHFPSENLDVLEEKSPLIVNATYIGDRVLKEWLDVPTGEVIATGSESKVKVNEILKGEINNNSSIISIYEPAYFIDKTFVSIEGYNLMNEEDNYLLFLRPMKNEEGYVIVGIYQGKYNLSFTELVKPVKSIKTFKDIKEIEFFGDTPEDFNELKSQVLEKYLEK